MDCLACDIVAGRVAPTGGFIVETSLWTVNHAIGDTPWRGALVVQPRRHVEALHALTPDELHELPLLLSQLDGAIRIVLHAEKTYVCLFAESVNCQHLHFHLIPRYPDTPVRGPEIFTLSSADHPDVFATAEMTEQIVASLRDYLRQ